jgi:Tfp pilus assembly protein PilV
VSAGAVIHLPGRLGAKLRNEDGIGLIELLIALLVLNIGIFATLAAFTSGTLAIRRASHISTATAIADQQIEGYRDGSYAAIPTTNGSTIKTGADGRQYLVAWSPSSTYSGSVNVKGLTLTVYDGATTSNRVLVTTSSTYSRCAQDLTTIACGGS